MGLYTLYDFMSKEIKINNADFDTLIFSNILTDLEFVTAPTSYILGNLRLTNFYDMQLKLGELIDTRHEDSVTLSLDVLDRSGSTNSVFMLNQGLEWQKMSKPVKGYTRITNITDDAILFNTTTFNTINLISLINCSIYTDKLIPNSTTASCRTGTYFQGSGETNWSKITLSQKSSSQLLDMIPEKTDMSIKKVTLFSRTNTCELSDDAWVVDKNGQSSKVISMTKNEVIKTNDIKSGCACSYKSVSVISDIGYVLYWGQTSVADIMPPTDVKFVCVRAGYYGFVGVAEDGKLYVWGESSTTMQLLKTNLPTGNDFIDADLGFNYGVALKRDGTLYAWGTSTSYVLPVNVPSGTFKKITCGNKVACALGTDGIAYVFGSADDGSLIANRPTFNDLIDADLNHQLGLYVRADGTMGKWGTGTGATYVIPASTVGKKFVKVKSGRNAFSAFDDKGFMYTWGYSSMVSSVSNPVPNCTDTANDQYFGVYITTDGKINIYSQLMTTDPVKSVVANRPASTIKAIMSGTYLAGYEYSMTLDKTLTSDDMHLVSGTLLYNITDSSPAVKTLYTRAVKSNVSLSNNVVSVEYEPIDVNTNKITLFYEVNNENEQVFYIQSALDKFKIGE